ncbi:bifunctional 2-polyprenyl-6-hydroxyphenol methylase/3-demethylubiquinol 3-O-methyltransferase UbiG [Cellulomonas sp. SLBN-39]|uniref:class I SAM-dependent methyltransferase n=1 Tax=Cellulomonas sp. SLBN-39 TaxID=2768446 RepID=UPI0011517703|nr:class I SAM-dependent methyltransferase [Cellulomonas sp. SLBN-39]TQL04049.1 methyltransferase family protein [Cellulomonas sp. SLBN-39]
MTHQQQTPPHHDTPTTGGHGHHHGTGAPDDELDVFEPAGWEIRYAGDAPVWSGEPNPQLVTVASGLGRPGTALDLGCGEGGDVVWLARQGWRVTGADFSANGLARAARHAADAGVADRVDWWQVDARTFAAGGRSFDLVTSHYLHPAAGGIVDVVRRLCEAVAPGGHLLVVGHAPTDELAGVSQLRRAAMFEATDLVPALPDDVEVLAAERRPRTVVRDGVRRDIQDAVLVARRGPERP